MVGIVKALRVLAEFDTFLPIEEWPYSFDI